MKHITGIILSLALAVSVSTQALAAYEFGSGADTLGKFGHATSSDEPITPDPMSTNTRRNKDNSALPPPYFYGSGDIPTEPSSLYHDNLPNSGFVPQNQDLPPNGGEDYAPGSGNVSVSNSIQQPTSVIAAQDTIPLYYADGSIGTLYVARTNKTIKVYEGEDLANLKLGAGHFASTSAWDGNIAMAGHNRGSRPYFSFVKDMEIGDILTYTTPYGTRIYEVYSKTQISELDSSALSWSAENILTLITCVADVPELRYSVKAKEIR
jgi:sortase A